MANLFLVFIFTSVKMCLEAAFTEWGFRKQNQMEGNLYHMSFTHTFPWKWIHKGSSAHYPHSVLEENVFCDISIYKW